MACSGVLGQRLPFLLSLEVTSDVETRDLPVADVTSRNLDLKRHRAVMRPAGSVSKLGSSGRVIGRYAPGPVGDECHANYSASIARDFLFAFVPV